MELKVWTPFFDLDKEWRLFNFPRLIGEHDFAFRPSIDITRQEGELIVTAELPAFIGAGTRLDVTVSSLGDATSLAGGSRPYVNVGRSC